MLNKYTRGDTTQHQYYNITKEKRDKRTMEDHNITIIIINNLYPIATSFSLCLYLIYRKNKRQQQQVQHCKNNNNNKIEKIKWENQSSFINKYVLLEKPVIIKNFVKKWPAFKKWTPSFFLNYTICNNNNNKVNNTTNNNNLKQNDDTENKKSLSPTVIVSIGNEESSTSNSHKKKITLCTYTQTIMNSNGNDMEKKEKINYPYLKQLDIFQILPSLKKDIDINPFSDWYSTFKTTFLWIGGYGSMTGMHNDDENNVLCQIYGNKTVYLYPPSAREYLYVNSMYDSGTECCDVDVLNSIEDNQIKYPKFNQAKSLEIVCKLSPGDMLYIPKFWYHQVVSDNNNVSISVNQFVSTPYEFLRHGLKRNFFDFLHFYLFYKKDKCVCC